ncbi:HD-GYP domain-containing protein [Deinococcus sp. QL22]|uniref:HD-GYP domain-containing protein n=1 Tax=Deinococcus sp. QL22 TaxID=2939437 RepID=UPI0020173195|nr:HD domain-containing phosphohydrolase [Deinococcus sp. QL22]UQN07414.1 HD domain-containing protein [Deinococcus sp. QL22]
MNADAYEVPPSAAAEHAALSALLELNAALLVARTPPQVEEALTLGVVELMAARYAYFLRFDPQADTLTITTVSREQFTDPGATALGWVLRRGAGLSWQAIEQAERLATETAAVAAGERARYLGRAVLHIPASDLPSYAVRVGNAPDQDVMFAPLLTQDRQVLGVLTLGRISPGFTPQDRALLAAFANAGTLALERAHEERRAAESREGAMLALGMALEARDFETQGHTERTVALAERLGAALNLSAANQDALRQGAYLHDLGKLSVPDGVLLKPGPLSPEERALICTHTVMGEALARRLPTLPAGALAIVRSHHERWDGSGYPDRLCGTQIPLLARIFAVVDVYDALTHDRPYRPAFSLLQARAMLEEGVGTHFDPEILRAFLGLLDGL